MIQVCSGGWMNKQIMQSACGKISTLQKGGCSGTCWNADNLRGMMSAGIVESNGREAGTRRCEW